ncbi:MAG: penicillin-binding protein 2 [Chloroflexi bacterium]|nr:penicillin-binding protein 2 [Chloroflexota bacterium]
MKAPLKIPHRESNAAPNGNKQGPLDPTRFLPFYALMVFAVLGLTARLVFLQLVKGEEYDIRARDNREDRINIPAQRGVIYDRNGVLLARNVPSYNITITPAYSPDDAIRLQEIYQYVSELTGVPVNTPPLDVGAVGGDTQPPEGITELVAQQESLAPYTPVAVAKDVPAEIAFVIRERQRTLPGVDVQVIPLREYPTGPLTAHIVGYMGPITEQVAEFYSGLGFDPSRDKIGYAGIESWMQDVLAGKNGFKFIEEDVAGLELRTIGEPVNPAPGSNVYLTIDVRLQAAAQTALTRMIEDLNRRGNTTVSQNGVVIAMNPRTGEILAMVSWPTYDNQRFARFIPFEYYDQVFKDPTKPLLNQAISGQHPPGSVFKLIPAAGALQEGVVDPNRTLFDPGQIVITNRYFPNDPGQARTVVCWKREGHGDIDMLHAIAQSCSVYFYQIGGGYEPDNVRGIDIEGIFHYGNMFGYHRRTGVELPGELRGLIPDRDYKRINIGENWSTGDTYIASIGQGYVLATPIQVLDSVTPFVNNGWLIKPTLIKEVVDGEGNVVPIAQSHLPDTLREFVPVGTPGSYQLSPFAIKYRDALPETPEIDPVAVDQKWLDIVRRGMEEVYISGTAYIAELDPIEIEVGPEQFQQIPAAGKSGTAEYCDNIAQRKGICRFGAWPRHAWFVGYAPANNPEVAVVAFVYNGGEGSLTAGPIVQRVLQAYFDLKAVDASRGQ